MTTNDIEQITIAPMQKQEFSAVVDVLARALRDNPGTIGMLGQDPEKRLRGARTIFAILLSDMAQPPFVARSGGRVVGAAAVSPPETCFFHRAEAHLHHIHLAGRDISFEVPSVPWRYLPSLLRLGLEANQRIATNAREGAAHDPHGRHWHVELVGVEPALHGRGIGSKLMEAVLRQSDSAHEPAYLETDTEDNVQFYSRRGFRVIAEAKPLDVTYWYMERSPA